MEGTIGAQLQPNVEKRLKKQKMFTKFLNTLIMSFHHF